MDEEFGLLPDICHFSEIISKISADSRMMWTKMNLSFNLEPVPTRHRLKHSYWWTPANSSKAVATCRPMHVTKNAHCCKPLSLFCHTAWFLEQLNDIVTKMKKLIIISKIDNFQHNFGISSSYFILISLPLDTSP